VDQSEQKGIVWRLRMALAAILRLLPFAAAMVLMGVMWDACGGGSLFSASSSASPTSTSTKIPGSGAFLYVTENATGFISEYSRNSTNGNLNVIGKIAAGNPSGPVGIGTANSSSPYIYAVNSSSTSDNVFGYSLNNVSGALTELTGGAFSAGVAPQWITLTPNGNFAYVTNFGSNSISQFTVDTSTGVLTANSPANVIVPGSDPAGEVATDSFLYVSDQGNEDAISFPIDSTTGTLGAGTAVSLGEVGAAPGPMIIDASNNYIYATDTALGLVYAFLINNTGFEFINGYVSASPATNASVGLASVKTSQGVEFLYVANEHTNSITIFQVLSGGLLNPVTTFGSNQLSSPTGLAATTNTNVANGNSYLYVTNQALGVGNVVVYQINSTSGALTFKESVGTSNVNSQPMFPLIAY
jgi:6-phosphogluconolactonase (cycloisomerase 2 family)